MENKENLDLVNPENNFEGIDKEKFEKLKSHVSFKDGDMDLSDELKKQVVIDILQELNWNYVHKHYESSVWSEPQSFRGEMGE